MRIAGMMSGTGRATVGRTDCERGRWERAFDLQAIRGVVVVQPGGGNDRKHCVRRVRHHRDVMGLLLLLLGWRWKGGHRFLLVVWRQLDIGQSEWNRDLERRKLHRRVALRQCGFLVLLLLMLRVQTLEHNPDDGAWEAERARPGQSHWLGRFALEIVIDEDAVLAEADEVEVARLPVVYELEMFAGDETVFADMEVDGGCGGVASDFGERIGEVEHGVLVGEAAKDGRRGRNRMEEVEVGGRGEDDG